MSTGFGFESGFGSRFGAPAEVAARAPGRVTLMGDHTDHQRGLCLPIALPTVAHASARRRPDRVVRLASEQLPQTWSGDLGEIGPGTVNGWAGYAAGVLWALAREGYDVPGLDLLVDSDVPVGAGLSSSAAVEVAVALCVTQLLGLADDESLRQMLVRACVRAETEVVGAPTGGLDQTTALFARAGAALRLDFDDHSRRVAPLDLAGVSLLVIDTGVSHALVEGGYADRRAECDAAAAALGVASLRQATLEDAAGLRDPVLRRRTRHVVSESARVDAVLDAATGGDWLELGRLMNESHASLRDDLEVSCPELDLAVSAAVAAGALGARMTGGGFGGSAVALVPDDIVGDVGRDVGAAFVAAARRTPHTFGVAPSAAAVVVAPS